jgi:hypothetical protein
MKFGILFVAELSEDIFHLAQQRSALGFVFHARHPFQLLQEFTLAFVQLVGCLNSNFDEQIALPVTIQHGHAFPPDAHRRSGLRPFRDFQCVFAFESRHSNLSSQRRLGK